MQIPGPHPRPADYDSVGVRPAASVCMSSQGMLTQPKFEDHCPQSLPLGPPPGNAWDLEQNLSERMVCAVRWVQVSQSKPSAGKSPDILDSAVKSAKFQIFWNGWEPCSWSELWEFTWVTQRSSQHSLEKKEKAKHYKVQERLNLVIFFSSSLGYWHRWRVVTHSSA